MTNRPAGGDRSKRWPRAEYDWYREPTWVVEQLFAAIDFGPPELPDLIYDPCCGRGTILDVAKRHGHPTVGADVVDRKPAHRFNRGNLLRNSFVPGTTGGRALSVVCNPPYSYEADIAEQVIRRVLDMLQVRRAAFIVPLAFLCSDTRWRFFARDLMPSHVLVCSQRPTMPPGELVDEMPNPFEGGMQDYCWLVYTGPKHRWRTEIRWLQPGVK